MDIQGSFSKFFCYLCIWDSRVITAQTAKCEANRQMWAFGEFLKALFSPLHIEFDFKKQFVTALDKLSNSFNCLQSSPS